MALVTLAELREHLGMTAGVAEEDAAMLQLFLDGGQALIEAELGYAIAERYPVAPPAALAVAIRQLAALWYESREAATPADLRTAPFATRAIVDAFRDRAVW